MPWTWTIRTGDMAWNGKHIAFGYAGAPSAKNDPTMVEEPNVGPLPPGWYTIEPPVDTKTHGPYVLWLTPDPENEMFGRSAFGIHGDSVVHPGTASEGCIILAPWARHQIWESGDRRLQVISGVS